VKKILTFKLFEQIYLNAVNPFSKEKKYARGLRFANKIEAINSVRKVQEMLDKKEITLKDAIIASYIMSKRAELHKYPSPSIKEGGMVWDDYMKQLKRKEEN
jgi:DNA-binding protein H-NS